MGIPVSLPAAALYCALLAATCGLLPGHGARDSFRKAVIAFSIVIVAAAIWFTFLQYAIIQSWCRFCLATHASALFSAAWLLALSLKSAPAPPPIRPGFKAGLLLGLLGIAILIGGQFAALHVVRYEVVSFSIGGHSSAGRLNLYSGRFELDPDALPTLGSSSAPGFVVGLYDYTCTHCRRLHPLLKDVQARLAGRVTLIMLPAPLDAGCNPMVPVNDPANDGACEYARLALAVWRSRPAAFGQFDDWLFAPARIPTLPEARAKAENLVGKEALEEALGDSWVNRQIATDVRLYMATSQATNDLHLPQLIFADAAVSGSANDAAELERIIGERKLLTRSNVRPDSAR
jgi:protein-disulfide isomerase